MFAGGSTISSELTRLGGLLSAVIVLGAGSCTYLGLHEAFGNSSTANPADVRVQPISKPKLAPSVRHGRTRPASRSKSQPDPFARRASAARRRAERELARLRRAHAVPLLQKVHGRPRPVAPAVSAPPAPAPTPTLTVKKQTPAPAQNSGGTAAPTATTPAAPTPQVQKGS